MGDFRAMPSEYRDGSEPFHHELVAWASAYGAQHPDTFGGAWLEYVRHEPAAFASFTGELEQHRAALDPRIRVVSAERTVAEINATLTALRAFVADQPGVRNSWTSVDQARGDIVLKLETDDEDGFQRGLRAQFDAIVDVYYEQWRRTARVIHHRRYDKATQEIVVSWSGRLDEDELRLDVDEDPDEVRLTLWLVRPVGDRRGDGGSGAERLFGYAGMSEPTIRVRLEQPLGYRAIIDTTRSNPTAS